MDFGTHSGSCELAIIGNISAWILHKASYLISTVEMKYKTLRKSVALVTAILYCVDLENKNLQAISIVQNDYLATKMPPVEAQVIIRTPLAIRGWIMAKKLVLYDMKMLLIDDADRVLAE
nr:DEAD-box ATP-dependent RNA helicase 38-like [Tanacetum cinerariifolium]